MRFDGEKRRAENSQSACVQLVDAPLFVRIISRESPQQYTRLFTISTVYSRQSSFTLHWDWKDTEGQTDTKRQTDSRVIPLRSRRKSPNRNSHSFFFKWMNWCSVCVHLGAEELHKQLTNWSLTYYGLSAVWCWAASVQWLYQSLLDEDLIN